jgi:hypothetical protein
MVQVSTTLMTHTMIKLLVIHQLSDRTEHQSHMAWYWWSCSLNDGATRANTKWDRRVIPSELWHRMSPMHLLSFWSRTFHTIISVTPAFCHNFTCRGNWKSCAIHAFEQIPNENGISIIRYYFKYIQINHRLSNNSTRGYPDFTGRPQWLNAWNRGMNSVSSSSILPTWAGLRSWFVSTVSRLRRWEDYTLTYSFWKITAIAIDWINE